MIYNLSLTIIDYTSCDRIELNLSIIICANLGTYVTANQKCKYHITNIPSEFLQCYFRKANAADTQSYSIRSRRVRSIG